MIDRTIQAEMGRRPQDPTRGTPVRRRAGRSRLPFASDSSRTTRRAR
ncbi:MAG: hypothetical protein JWN84_1945 [Nocardioides sp.]|nr:hypothetical protein [Nocardioides sp.]